MAPSDASPILIVSGPPGAGKSTVARLLAARSTRGVHLEADLFFRFIRSGYVEPWKPESHEQNRVVMEVVAEAALGYSAAGYFTIVDGIVIPGWFFEPLRDAFDAAGRAVAYVVLRAPQAVCSARALSRESEPLDDDAVARVWESFADLGDLERNALDVDGYGAEEVCERVMQLLAEGKLDV